MPLVTMAGPGSRLYVSSSGDPGAPDVWDATWDFVVNRTDSEATVRSTFQSAGYDEVLNIENGTAETLGGWLYTVDSIPGYAGSFPEGATRVLCVETNPTNVEGDLWQADPSLQFWAETSPAGTIPADIWIQWWQYNCRSGVQQSTFDGRDKTLYVTQSDPPYPSTDFPWLALQGSAGFQHTTPSNDTDNYLALQSLRSAVPYDSGSDPVGYQKMFQNLSSAVITPNAWFQVRMHIDTSGAEGSAEMWIRERGTPTWTKVMEWLPGVTQFDPGNGVGTFQWPTSAEDRAGAKVMRWPSTTNGEGRHAFRYFKGPQMATAENLLATGD